MRVAGTIQVANLIGLKITHCDYCELSQRAQGNPKGHKGEGDGRGVTAKEGHTNVEVEGS